MADPSRKLPQNVAGDFFVDSTCIDCDTCRQLAPATFRDHGDASSVYHQPETAEEVRSALMALVACPTASIGAETKHDLREIIGAFPLRLDGNVFYCGFTSEASFGAWSYLIVRPLKEGGNILIDSPRFTRPLVNRIEEMGGVRTMFLTHRDDVADHDKFAKEFNCSRVMHSRDGAKQLGVQHIIDGNDPVMLDGDTLVIPTPGHTPGHAVLLYRNKYLFTGDHLYWSPVRKTLSASKRACWYSWREQLQSMQKLLDYQFEWVLPGHGPIHHDSAEAMHRYVEECVAWMKKAA